MNLALSNIRKSKSATVSLFIFILVAALLLNIGLMVITQINAFFDSKAEQLKDPHAIIMMDHASYHSKYGEFITNYPGVTETETEEAILMNLAKYNFGDNDLTSSAAIFNAENHRTIGKLKLVEKLNNSSTNDIFIPNIFKTNGNYELGEEFTITYQNKNYDFRVAGFFETAMMGTTSVGIMKFMLPAISYEIFADELDKQMEGLVLSAMMEDKIQSTNLINDFTKAYPGLSAGDTNSFFGH